MSETKVITVTLNPSLDRTLVTHYLAVGYHNRTGETTRLDPAGQGVNIARAVNRLGIYTHAILLLGDDATGRAYQALLAEEGFAITSIRIKGQTRSDTIILDTGNQTETHIIEDSAEVTGEDLAAVGRHLEELISEGDIVVFAGPLPHGAPSNTYATLTDIAQQAGADVALIASGEPLAEALPAHPDLVALRQIEVESIFNYPVRFEEDIVGSAQKLCERGAGRVMIVMEEDGHLVLADQDTGWSADLPVAGQGTTSGVWDALIAGYVAGRVERQPVDEALRLGAGAAAFTASRVGNEFGARQDVETSAREIVIKPVSSTPEPPDEVGGSTEEAE